MRASLRSRMTVAAIFGNPLSDLLQVIRAERWIRAGGLSGAVEQPTDLSLTPFGQFALALVAAGFTLAHIHAYEGNEGIAVGEDAAKVGGDQGGGIERADAGDGAQR